MQQSPLYGRTQNPFMKILFSKFWSTKGGDAIVDALHKPDALSAERGVLRFSIPVEHKTKCT